MEKNELILQLIQDNSHSLIKTIKDKFFLKQIDNNYMFNPWQFSEIIEEQINIFFTFIKTKNIKSISNIGARAAQVGLDDNFILLFCDIFREFFKKHLKNQAIDTLLMSLDLIDLYKSNYQKTYYNDLIKQAVQKLEGLHTSLHEVYSNQQEEIRIKEIQLHKEKAATAQQEAEKRKQYSKHLAHDVMSPLTSLLCEMNNFIETRDENDLVLVRTHIFKLIEMIGSFIDYEKIEKGVMIYRHKDYFDLSRYLASKIKLSANLFKSKRIKVQTSIQDGIYIRISKHALDRIINNVIDNAVKYTKENGTIELILKKEKEVFFIIKDTGTGMSKEQLNNLFIPYYKSVSATGTGEGLCIVKNILSEVSGTIQVESIQNAGTSVIMTFREANIKDAKKIIVNSHSPIVLLHNPDVKIREKDFDSFKKSILIIEDDVEFLSLMYDKFSEEFNVFYAYDGKEALELLNDSLVPLPEIIISDIMMKKIDGHELYKRIRTYDILKDIPVIFITAKRDEKDKIKSYKKGVLDYIQKPFTVDDLLYRIKALLYTINQRNQESYFKMMYEKREQIMRDPINDGYICWYLTCEKYEFKRRERQIARYYLDGYYAKEIAEKLHISLHTVKSHAKSIFKKCKINNRAELNTLFKFYDREIRKVLITDHKNKKAIEEALKKDWKIKTHLIY